jgi:hypothetical protein
MRDSETTLPKANRGMKREKKTLAPRKQLFASSEEQFADLCYKKSDSSAISRDS